MSGERTFLDCLPALVVLTERERETWVDVHLLGLSQRAIAARDGVTESCIAHRLARAERRLERRQLPEAVAA